jgi:hypothetical protein
LTKQAILTVWANGTTAAGGSNRVISQAKLRFSLSDNYPAIGKFFSEAARSDIRNQSARLPEDRPLL